MDEFPRLFDMRPLQPGKILRQMMTDKGWTQDELAAITGISRQMLYMILSGKSSVTPETAVRFSAAFGNSAEEWIKWDGLYRLSTLKAESDVSEIGKMALFYQAAPIRDMQKRGWISPTNDPRELEDELTKFFGQNPLEGDLKVLVAAKRTATLPTLNPAERAWLFRARHLAGSLRVTPFSPKRLDQAERRLRELAAYPKEARHLPKVLAEYGIRFAVVEPLPGVRIDGAAFWFFSEPCIVLSIRHDRIDSFWFTLMHEFAHIRNGDASVDTDLVDGMKGIAVTLVEEEAEQIANKEAANSLIPSPEMDSFIRRVGPLYPRERIIQFAHKMKIHPGIIVGQLQYRNEMGYGSFRDLLVKIRDVVVSTTLTDGWDQTIAPGIL